MLVGIIALVAAPGSAQHAWVPRVSPGFGEVAGPSAAGPERSASAPLASALLPGAGQALQGRWLGAALFGALEVGAWIVAYDARQRGRSARVDYRQLADDVARGAGSGSWPSDFEYVERMSFWVSSGRLDTNPDRAGIQPERDATTWNGAQWRLAANLHLGGDVAATPATPGYADALAWYMARAYGEAQSWDWSGDPGAQQDFRDLIRRSDDGFRRASLMGGIVLANHLVSPLEAWLRRRTPVTALGLALNPPGAVYRGPGHSPTDLMFLLSLNLR